MLGSAIEVSEVVSLLSSLKTRMPISLQALFDWDAIGQEKVNLKGKMIVFIWFRAEVSAWDRKRTLTVFAKGTGREIPCGSKSCGQNCCRTRT